MGNNKAALLHLLAHVCGHNGRRHGSGLRALDLVCKGVAKAHAFPQAHVSVCVISRPGKWLGRLLPQLGLLLFPLTDLQASRDVAETEVNSSGASSSPNHPHGADSLIRACSSRYQGRAFSPYMHTSQSVESAQEDAGLMTKTALKMRGNMRCTCAMPPPQEGFSCFGFLASFSACSSSAPPSSRVPFSLSLYTVLAARPVFSASSCAKRSLSACTRHACTSAANQPHDLQLPQRLCRKHKRQDVGNGRCAPLLCM